MGFAMETGEQGITVRFERDIFAKEATELKERLFPLLREGGREIVFYLEQVERIDSSGMGVLVAARQLARQSGVSFRLEGVRESVRSRLAASGASDPLVEP